MLNNIMRSMPMLHNGHKLIISTNKHRYLLLHFKTQNYHLKHSNVLHKISHRNYLCTSEKLLILTNSITLTVDGCDTTKPLGIFFRPIANSACDTNYHKRNGVQK
jgi:hypothetical protein